MSAPNDVWQMTHFVPQWQYVCDTFLRPIVTRMLRFERLADDWRELCQDIGVEVDLPTINQSDHMQWQAAYTSEMRARLSYLYHGDFALLPYSNNGKQ